MIRFPVLPLLLRLNACLLFCSGILFCNLARAQGLMVNEASNGPSGSKEYVEYVVLGTTCSTVDLRGWIIDDNNGDFACGPISGVGIAQGHMRFAASATWAAVPAGALILIYNDADLNVLVPAQDPTDANADSIYILPSSSLLFERTSGGTTCPPDPGDQIPMGCTASCPATGSTAYAPVTYVAGGSNTQVSLANGGDATQVRNPAGAYFHGISYGGVSLTGGPDNLKISSLSGTGKVYFFSGGNFRSVANWTEGFDDGVAGGDETPGLANNAANAAFIDSILGNCLLPVTFAHPLEAAWENEAVQLRWTTASEVQSAGFAVMRRSPDEADFTRIGWVDSQSPALGAAYTYRDETSGGGLNYYRLLQQDLNGSAHFSPVVAVMNPMKGRELNVSLFPNPAQNECTLAWTSASFTTLALCDLTGRQLRKWEVQGSQETQTLRMETGDLTPGLYFIRFQCGAEVQVLPLRIQR